ncbi:hypothetical protein LHFGNBLO_005807 [Mesorhizobium sp. AR10]|uniref:hypothetical protein n=1 Tax=Mesorhizobium sp. AR10 TaxID=2865839 RepID=UPI00215F0247|nr:hypothetical protein [Mesorhizobium sp. AR10]UVK38620.1 hypothetical protein LHFGNBLO_005807 [Mesorhizobium sp. AR10]
MPRYQIDEMDGDDLAASHVANGETALQALHKITVRPISPRALQRHWFRVVDESEGIVFEYSYEESAVEIHPGGPSWNATP